MPQKKVIDNTFWIYLGDSLRMVTAKMTRQNQSSKAGDTLAGQDWYSEPSAVAIAARSVANPYPTLQCTA